jgi:hypothetical protein
MNRRKAADKKYDLIVSVQYGVMSAALRRFIQSVLVRVCMDRLSRGYTTATNLKRATT